MHLLSFPTATLAVHGGEPHALAEHAARLHGRTLTLVHPFGDAPFYRHGWHSWSVASWFAPDAPQLTPRPRVRWPMLDDPALLAQGGHISCDVALARAGEGRVLLVGACTPGGRITLEGDVWRLEHPHGGPWLVLVDEETRAWATYTQHIAKQMGARGQTPAPRVWCSWYSFYREIDADRLHTVIHHWRGWPFDVIQIDDGWQHAIGDWDANERFPDGMATLAKTIHAHGFRAGLWLAPFIVHEASRLFAEHPDWLVHDEEGRPVVAGNNWGGHFYALDTTHPEAQTWLRETFHRVAAWGYDYLKLDFLYAAALPGKRHTPMPREDAYRLGMRLIRETVEAVHAERTYILACGAPILASVGLADGIRVGPDVAPFWQSEDRAVWLGDWTGPATQNAIATTLHRLWLRPLLHTDPDVAYFRTHYNLLSPTQKEHLQDLAHIAGFLATSDPLPWLSEDEQAALRAFLTTTPRIEQVGRYTFRLDGRLVDFSAALQGWLTTPEGVSRFPL